MLNSPAACDVRVVNSPTTTEVAVSKPPTTAEVASPKSDVASPMKSLRLTAGECANTALAAQRRNAPVNFMVEV